MCILGEKIMMCYLIFQNKLINPDEPLKLVHPKHFMTSVEYL